MSSISYIALYRKWRPQTFEDVVGQEHITKILKNQILNQQLAHAYLFSGTRGTGKTSVAKIFAKAMNCLSESEDIPCNQCEICKSIQKDHLLDVVEMDAASNNGVDDIRELRENIQYPPTNARYKVYIIDEVHMLSTGAFNALLKTLEEPPSYIKFILATTEPHKLPATILSRCQRFDFKRVKEDDIVDRMIYICEQMNLDYESEALKLIARNADGALRDALSLMDRCIAYGVDHIAYDDVIEVLGVTDERYISDLVDYIIEKNTRGAIGLIETLVSQGKDIQQFIRDLILYYRNVLMTKITEDLIGVVNLSKENIVRLKNQGKSIDIDELTRIIGELSKTSLDAKWSTQPRILMEVAIIKFTNPETNQSVEGLMDRVKQLEQQILDGLIEPRREAMMTEQVPEIANSNTQSISPIVKKNQEKKADVDFAGEAMLEDLKKLWHGIWQEIKGVRPSVASMIKDAELLKVDENNFEIIFKTNKDLLNSYFEKKENRQLLEEAFKTITGKERIMKILIKQNEKKIIKKEDEVLKKMFGDEKIKFV